MEQCIATSDRSSPLIAAKGPLGAINYGAAGVKGRIGGERLIVAEQAPWGAEVGGGGAEWCAVILCSSAYDRTKGGPRAHDGRHPISHCPVTAVGPAIPALYLSV